MTIRHASAVGAGWRASALAATVLAGAALASPVLADELEQRREVEKNLQHFRLDDRYGGNYRQYRESEFDLSRLPVYRPGPKLRGWIRIAGLETLAHGNLARLMEEEFRKYQPEVRFSYNLAGAEMALTPLYYRVADVTFTRELGFYDVLPYERIFNAQPLRLVAFTGSYDVPGYSPAYKILANAKNPLSSLTMAQVDGIFGAARDGGWVGTHWEVSFSRGKEDNLRKWGDLGLDGTWREAPIRLHGHSMRSPEAVTFNDLALKGSDKWNEKTRTYGPYTDASGARRTADGQIADAVAADPHAIGYVLDAPERNDVKVLGLAPAGGGQAVRPDAGSVRARSYPLHRSVHMQMNMSGNGHVDPLAAEFARFVLSRQGQAQVVKDGKYLPLTESVLAGELEKVGGGK